MGEGEIPIGNGLDSTFGEALALKKRIHDIPDSTCSQLGLLGSGRKIGRYCEYIRCVNCSKSKMIISVDACHADIVRQAGIDKPPSGREFSFEPFRLLYYTCDQVSTKSHFFA